MTYPQAGNRVAGLLLLTMGSHRESSLDPVITSCLRCRHDTSASSQRLTQPDASGVPLLTGRMLGCDSPRRSASP